MSAAVTTPIGVLALGGGAVMLWAAFTGQNPLAELRDALSTGRVEPGGGPRPIEVDDLTRAVYTVPGSDGSPTTTGPPSGASSAQRVPIGQGSHTLNPAAARAFRQAEQNYGRSIPITDSSRDYATQAANRQRNPSRFGPADGNAHVEGRAVDVNLPALGLNPQGEPDQWARDPGYRKLLDAMTSAGWCNYQVKNGTANGRTREPWHFAVGRCN